MLKRVLHILMLVSALLLGSEAAGQEYLRMKVENGDTLYFDKIRPVWKTGRDPRSSQKQWHKYYKLVYRFPRVYPYAMASGVLIRQVDSTVAAEGMGAWKKDRYISSIQKELFKDFEGSFRQMTIYQGALMLKLISRETGLSAYDIIKGYKNGAAAAFWQGVAKFFENDLKSAYDPAGEDKDIEELVQIWQAGDFPNLYFSVFGEYPPAVKLPEKYLKGSRKQSSSGR